MIHKMVIPKLKRVIPKRHPEIHTGTENITKLLTPKNHKIGFLSGKASTICAFFRASPTGKHPVFSDSLFVNIKEK